MNKVTMERLVGDFHAWFYGLTTLAPVMVQTLREVDERLCFKEEIPEKYKNAHLEKLRDGNRGYSLYANAEFHAIDEEDKPCYTLYLRATSLGTLRCDLVRETTEGSAETKIFELPIRELVCDLDETREQMAKAILDNTVRVYDCVIALYTTLTWLSYALMKLNINLLN